MGKNNRDMLAVIIVGALVLVLVLVLLSRASQPVVPEIPIASPSATFSPLQVIEPTVIGVTSLPTDLPDPTRMGGGI